MKRKTKTRSWKLASFLCLTGLLLIPAYAELDIRHPVQTWDIRTTTAQQYQPVQLYRSESMTFDLQARNGRTPVDLSGTNTIVTWEICDWDNLTNVYLAVTGSVLNATNGQVRYTLDRSQSDTLENGVYKGFAWARQGTNNAGILAAQQLRILGTPATRYATMEPIPYAWDINASNLLAETAARIAADDVLSTQKLDNALSGYAVTGYVLADTTQSNSYVSGTQLGIETTARQNADAAIQADVDTKATASALLEEAAARINADSALSNYWNNLEADFQSLETNLTAETTARLNADSALSTNIEARLPASISGITVTTYYVPIEE